MKKITVLSSSFGIILAVGVLNTAIYKHNIKKNDLQASATTITYTKKNFKPFYQPEEVKEVSFMGIGNVKGVYALYVKNLSTGKTSEFNPDMTFYAASLYKIPVAVGVLKAVEAGDLKLDSTAEYTESDFSTGTGTIIYDNYGTKYTVLTLIEKLLKDSDNAAQNILLRITPSKYINRAFQSAGIEQSLFHKYNYSSPREISIILEKVYTQEIINKENSKLLLKIMSETSFDDRINSGLSKERTFTHKIGNWGETGSWHDCGIVLYPEPIVVCLMSEGTTFNEFVNISTELGKTL